jgi:hypothetical protein
VHHRAIQINQQTDATIFHFIILSFIYSSKCFGRFPAHHQELNDCSGSLWFYLHIVVTVVLCSWSGRPARPRVGSGSAIYKQDKLIQLKHKLHDRCSHNQPEQMAIVKALQEIETIQINKNILKKILINTDSRITLDSLKTWKTGMISAGERPQTAHLLRSWVRIPPGAWIFVCCECRVLSGRGLCDELITRPEDSYRLCCIVVCDLETSRICAPYIYIYIYIYDISSLGANGLTLTLLTWRKW